MSFSSAGSTEGGGSLLGTDLVTARILADGSMALSVLCFYLVHYFEPIHGIYPTF